MTPERWKQVEELFHAVLELPADSRPEFLDKQINGDTTLRDEVEKLLSQYDEADSFISQPLLDSTGGGVLSSLLDDVDDDPLTGQVLGNYRIERQIGRGGMGAVYEASRADGEFQLKVAIKVVKRGVDTDFVLRRFRNERQILATLDHPYITRLIDGGTTADGRPYFVMDHIDGPPLYRYADKERLSVTEKLRLFCRICEAVEYAHSKQVIHRDLKPSNILVAADGTPRLLDFGIAKLLNPELAVDTLQPTATALRMMTVDYASPEQVKGELITYATDVYSLGVILFELLTGHRPYNLKSRAPHDVARAICDEEPELPSRAVTDGASPVVPVNTSATTLPGVRPSVQTREEISKELRGNLDSIIMKAMRKSPSDRYESVAALGADIRKHLEGDDVDVPLYFSRNESIHGTYSPEGKTLAVLPLSVFNPTDSQDTDEAYLNVGLADAIITRLTSVRQLTVRPTSSITRYNEHQINPLRAGRELGVDFVLDGRIRRFGERIRISLQLLDVQRGSAIWAGHFDEHLTDVLELEDKISEHVAAVLIPQLTGAEKKRLAKRGTNDPQAYEAYLRGRFYWNQFTSQSLPKALEAYHQAIARDPGYALAHVGIAEFYIWANIYGLIPVSESYKQANAAARRAVEIDHELGEAYAAFGLLTLNQFEYTRSEELFQRSIRLNPGNALAHEWYAAMLLAVGRRDQGLEEMAVAEELDPLSLRTKTISAWCFYQAGEFEKALKKADEIIELDANYPQGYMQRGYVLCELDQPEEGIKCIEKSIALMPGSALNEYQYAFALASGGRHEDAHRQFETMKSRSETEFIKPIFLAYAAVAAGEIDEAFRYFDIAVAERDPWLVWLMTEPKLEPIRSDARYDEMVRETNRPHEGVAGAASRTTGGTAATFDESFGRTIVADGPITGPFNQSFFRKHLAKFAAAALLVLVSGYTLYRLGFIAFSIQSASTSRAVAPIGNTLAVLPFVNETADPASEYLSDGIAESLIQRMSAGTGIKVISRDAVHRFKGSPLEPTVIGRELGADSVLAGRVSRSGGSIVVNLALLRVSDGKLIAAYGFEEGEDRTTLLQNKIINAVSAALGANALTAVAPRSGTENNEAFQHYLKGEFYRHKGTPADTRTAIENYQKAAELDPQYALAHLGLALAYRMAPAYGTHSPQEAYPAAKAAAQTALSIDPTLGSAHVPLASIKFVWDWDFAGAENEYKQALRLAPNNSEAHYSYGNFLVAVGRVDQALNELRMAQQLDPLSLTIASNISWALYIAGRFDEAENHAREVLVRDPNFARAYLSLGEIYLEQGRYNEAITAIERSRQLAGDPLTDMALGHVYATAGRTADAKRIAADLESKAMKKEVSSFLPAVVHAGLNDKDKAFYWLERAFQERSNWLVLIKAGHRMKNLHGDPRFDDLLKRIGF